MEHDGRPVGIPLAPGWHVTIDLGDEHRAVALEEAQRQGLTLPVVLDAVVQEIQHQELQRQDVRFEGRHRGVRERACDHATNVAENVIDYLEGRDVRHPGAEEAVRGAEG